MNEIIKLKDDATTKTLKLNEDNFWFSVKEHKDFESFKKIVEKNNGKFLNSHGIVPYKFITKIRLNEKSDKIKFKYTNIKGKDEEIDLSFDQKEDAMKIGEFIANKTSLKKDIQAESTTKALLINILYILGSIGITAFLAMGEDLDVDQDSYSRSARRARSGKVLINMIHNLIGQTGIILIGTIVTAYFIFKTWKRYKNPANDIIFQ